MTTVGTDPRRACRRIPSLAGIAAVLATFLCACESAPTGSQPTSPGAPASIDERREAFTIDHDAYASLGYRLDWRGFPVVARGGHVEFIDPFNDLVIVQDSRGTITALEADTGAVRFSGQVATALTKFVGTIRHDTGIVVSSDSESYTLDPQTGTMLARDPFSRVVTTRPVLIAGRTIYGTPVGHVYAHMVSPPVDAWAYDMGSPIDVAPVRFGDLVAVVSRRGDLAVLDGASGSLISRARVFSGCSADPVAGDRYIYIASLDQSVYAFDPETGRQAWRVRTEAPLEITPTYADATLYVPSSDKGLRALDGATGAERWAAPEVAGRVIAIRDGWLLTWDGSSAVTVDPATGDVVARAELPGLTTLAADAFQDGHLYAISQGGVVARFTPRD